MNVRRPSVRLWLVASALTLAVTACTSETAGSASGADSGDGTASQGTEAAGTDATTPPPAAPEISQLAPVCDAIRSSVSAAVGVPDLAFEPTTPERYEGAENGVGCSVTSDTFEDDFSRDFELSVSTALHPDGAAGIQEQIELREPLPGEPVQDTEVEVAGAQRAFLAPGPGEVVMLSAFQANVEIYVLYRDSAVSYDQLAEQAAGFAEAALAANNFT